jgi:WbqC-like protein family
MEPSEAGSPDKPLSAAVLPLAYFPPIPYFKYMLRHEQIVFDLHEHFHKQFYYNRCLISSPNGILKLTVPIIHKHKKCAIKDVQISYEYNWTTLHWRSIEAAYRRSPYFEFYEHHFTSIYSDFKPTFLVEWNLKIFEILNTILGTNPKISFSNEYKENQDSMDDYRALASPLVLAAKTTEAKKYQQVFEERHGFFSDLSIIDLLFCEGPHALDYLKN